MARGVRTVKVRFDGETRGLAAAARQGEAIVGRFGKQSGRRFVDNFEHEFNRGGIQTFARMAGRFAAGFGAALQGALIRDPRIAGALGAAVLAAIVVGMPVLGSLAAGLFVSAFGLGLAGLGIIFAAQSKRVKFFFSEVGKETAETMRQISRPFQTTLIVMLGQFQAFFGSLAAPLRDAFAELAPALEGFTDHLFRSLGPDGLGRIIGPVTDAFVRLLGALGPQMPVIMSDLADAIIAVADSISENPQTFADLVTFLFSLVSGTLQFIAALSRLANWFQEHPEVTKPLIGALTGILGPLGLVIVQFQNLQSAIEFTTDNSALTTKRNVGFILGAVDRLRSIGVTVGRFFGQAVIAAHQKWGEVVAFVRTIPGMIFDALGRLDNLLYTAGTEIIGGLAAGIRDAAGNAVDAAVDAVRDAMNAARNFIDPGSPSKRARRELGLPIGQGIAAGMRDARRLVASEALSLTKAAFPTTPTATSAPVAARPAEIDYAKLADALTDAVIRAFGRGGITRDLAGAFAGGNAATARSADLYRRAG